MKPPITLEELIDLGEKHVNRILLERREKEMYPLWHLVTPGDDKDLIIMTPWDGDFEKKLSVAKIKQIAHENKATAVCFITECWMVDSGKIPPGIPNTPWHQDQLMKKAMAGAARPSQSPNRIEAVMILAHDKERTIAKGLQTIRDRPGGRIISFIEHLPIGESKFESWMLEGMLPPRGVL